MLSSHQDYLSEALDKFCTTHLASLESDFVAPLNPPPSWINFSLSPTASDFAQQASLRRHLSRLWPDLDDDQKVDVVKYYVVDWGGIGGNKPETLHDYALLSVPALRRDRPWSGVSSWSKVLSFRSRHDSAILDSRVIASLHAIQILYGSGIAVKFPKLTSRDTDISAFEKAFATAYRETRTVSSNGLYELYCRLVSEAFQRWDATHNSKWHWHALETALFFQADKLTKEAQSHTLWGQTCNPLLLPKV
jgi:hypothetical protein